MAVKLLVGELARSQGLTITALAKRAGVAYNTAHALYTARATRIDLETLDRIAVALEVEPGDVFGRHAPAEAGPDRHAKHASADAIHREGISG
jgi:DNA-binding Xre family transcriptional regulator